MMPADEAAIRAAYKLKDRCYETRDLVRLATNDLPSFFARGVKGQTISHVQVWQSIRWRMAHQVSCHRQEKPLRIEVLGSQEIVEVSTSDDFTYRTKGGVKREVERLHGWSDWTKTSSGWKQASLRFDRSEWRDAKGVWHGL